MTGDPPPTVPMRSRPTHAEGLGVQRSVDFDRTYQLLCGCSYKVRCEVMRHGERLGELTAVESVQVLGRQIVPHAAAFQRGESDRVTAAGVAWPGLNRRRR